MVTFCIFGRSHGNLSIYNSETGSMSISKADIVKTIFTYMQYRTTSMEHWTRNVKADDACKVSCLGKIVFFKMFLVDHYDIQGSKTDYIVVGGGRCKPPVLFWC